MSLLLSGALLALQAAGGGWQEAPPLPRPLTGHAVAAVETPEGGAVLVFPGVPGGSGGRVPDTGTPDPAGRPADPVRPGWPTFRWDVGTDAWREGAPVPGTLRRSVTAAGVGARAYLMGGYTLNDDGSRGAPVDRVDVYDAVADAWTSATPLPVPVEGAVAGVWRDSLIYVVGGARDDSPQTAVQVFDPAADRWWQATPLPAAGGTGSAGAVARDAIAYLGTGVGSPERARPEDGSGASGVDEATSEPSFWLGAIDPSDPTRIAWRRLGPPPGPARHGAVAAAVGTRVAFVGGSAAPPRDGSGGPAVDARAEPLPDALLYDLVTGGWSRAPGPPEPTTGHRGMVRAGGWLVLPGGATAGAPATGRVWRISVVDLVAGGR